MIWTTALQDGKTWFNYDTFDTKTHDDVIKCKHFPRYWPFVWKIHRSPVNSLHKYNWRRALMFSLICALNKRLSKQSWDWWFETPSCPLWRHCNGKSNVDALSIWPSYRRLRYMKNGMQKNSIIWVKMKWESNVGISFKSITSSCLSITAIKIKAHVHLI